MIKYLLFLILLTSCATNSKKTNWKSFSEKPDYHEKLIPVSGRDEARKVIGNKVNFIKMLFQQSIDPYFGTPRWSDYCLAINLIGEVSESSEGIQSISTLFLNPQGEPGFCNDKIDQNRSHVIFVYCNGMQNVMEIKFTQKLSERPFEGSLCE